MPWNSYKNYQIAKAHGFHDLTHEWDRTHHAENFDQIASRAYLSLLYTSGKAQRKADRAHVGVFTLGHFGNQLLDNNIQPVSYTHLERIALIALPFTGTFRSSCSLLLMFTSGLLT